jgi:hypothetical protein
MIVATNAETPWCDPSHDSDTNGPGKELSLAITRFENRITILSVLLPLALIAGIVYNTLYLVIVCCQIQDWSRDHAQES